MLQLNDISKEVYTKYYRQEILSNVNLTIRQGEFVIIVGPSGSGKTTLLNILSLLDAPSKGKYLIDEQDATKFKASQKSSMRNSQFGYVLQDFALLPDYTVFENVEYPLIIAKVDKKARRKKVEGILKRLDMLKHKNKIPSELSGGQQQRVAIARAIVNSPKVIFADEPTGALDSENSQNVLSLINEINNEGTTVVLVTHDQKIAEQAKRVISIFDGKIVEDKIKENN